MCEGNPADWLGEHISPPSLLGQAEFSTETSVSLCHHVTRVIQENTGGLIPELKASIFCSTLEKRNEANAVPLSFAQLGVRLLGT